MKRSLSLLFLISYASMRLAAQSECKVVRLFTNNQEHSAITASIQPRFSWQLISPVRGQLQTAYQLLVSDDSSLLHQQIGNYWNTGKVRSSQSQLVAYAGKALQPGRHYFWKMRIWDRNGKITAWSRISSWRTGLQTWEQWQAQWITNSRSPEDTTDRFAAFQFRKSISLTQKPVSAIAWFCGLGFSELYVNDQKISSGLMAPAWTDYRKRVLYQTFDITSTLQNGNNTFGVLLGNGWYNLPTPDLFAYEKAPWKGQPRFLLRIQLTYADGSTENVVSGPEWKSRKSEILFNCIRGGETIDARKTLPGWASNDNKATDWLPVNIVDGPEGKPEPQLIPSEKIINRIKPVSINSPKPGVFIYDLGVHIAGYARFEASGEPGQKLTLDFDEALNEDGTITVRSRNSHTYGRYQTGELILSGNGRDVFEPRFTYHGFRFVQVSGLQSPPALDDLTGLQVHNELDIPGSFTCSDTLLNKIQAAYIYSMLNSFHGVLTEPAREKINWTQDAHNMIEGAILNLDFRNFAGKWLNDVMDSQQPNGWIPSINPNGGWGLAKTGKKPPAYSDPWWGGVVLEIPWIIYKYYGDTTVLRNAYQSMKQYVDFISTTTTDQYFLHWGIGDWLEVGAEHKGFPSRTPLVQTSTTAYFYYAKLLSETASLLGFRQDAIQYATLAGNIRTAFNKKFLNDSTGLYADDSQTSQILPLYLGIVPENKKALVLQQLVNNIRQRKGHLSTGFVGYLYLLYGLTELGHADLVYEMAGKKEYPGWGFMLKDGGTNLWESWTGIAYNFSSLGGVGNWFFQALAGINPDPEAPGFRNILLKPNFVPALHWAKAAHDSPYGKILSEWKKESGKINWTIHVPVNATATLHIPARKLSQITESGKPLSAEKEIRITGKKDGKIIVQLGSGRYRFTLQQ